MPGFEEVVSKLQSISNNLGPAAEEAVSAVQEPIFQASQGLVPVKHGRLKSSGKRHEPETDGDVTTGVITYGNQETIVWHGVGYEVLVHTPGTKYYGGVPYLEQPTLDAKGSAAMVSAEAMRKALFG